MQRKPPYTPMRPSTKRLRELREARGLDPNKLAEQIGIDHRTYASYELGKNSERFWFNRLGLIAHFYDVPLTELLEPVPTAIKQDGAA